MERLKDGRWVDFETKVGEVEFRDPNGSHTITVETDGEFWRTVSIELPAAGILPKAARKLAKLLMRAADIAEKEEAAIAKQDAAMP
jgi:hypothetical protein